MKHIVFTTLVLFLSSTAMSATEVANTQIEELSLVREYGEFVFVKLQDSAPRSDCSTNGYWDYTLPLDTEFGRVLYSTILSAYMAGKSVSISGNSNGLCSEFGSVETLNSVRLH